MAEKMTYYDVDGLSVRFIGKVEPGAKMECRKGGKWVPFNEYSRILESGYEVTEQFVEQSIKDLKDHHAAMNKRG